MPGALVLLVGRRGAGLLVAGALVVVGLLLLPEQAAELALHGGVQVGDEEVGGVGCRRRPSPASRT